MSNHEQDDEEQEWTYQEIFSEVIDSGSMTMTILRSELTAVKKGITNAKQANRKKALYNSLPWEKIVLRFTETECEDKEERDFYVDLTVAIEKKALVRIKRISNPKTLELGDD